ASGDTGARTSSSRRRRSWSARTSSSRGATTRSCTTCCRRTATPTRRRRDDPRGALAAWAPRAHRWREAPPVPRRRPRSPEPLSALSNVVGARPAPARRLARARPARRPLARVSDEPLRRDRGMTMAKTYQQIMDEARKLVPEVSPDEVKARIDRGTPGVLLDVREKEEIRQGFIPGAVAV